MAESYDTIISALTPLVEDDSLDDDAQGEEDILAAFDEWDPMMEHSHSALNSLAIDPDKDPVSVVTGTRTPNYSILGKYKICIRYAKYNECVDKDFCPYLHVDKHQREILYRMQQTYESNKGRVILTSTDLSPVEILVDASKLLLGSVTNTYSPTNFFMIFPYENMDFTNHSNEDMDFYMKNVRLSSTVKAKLEQFHKQMAAIYDHGWRIDNLLDDLYPSQIVACKLQTDGRFRRAMVTEVPVPHDDKFNYKLLLIDVGTEIELPRELIYDIKSECLNDGPLAMRCRLAVKPANGELNWTEEALNNFEELARKDKYICCKVTDYFQPDDIFTVDLITIDGRQSLTDTILERGYAEKVMW